MLPFINHTQLKQLTTSIIALIFWLSAYMLYDYITVFALAFRDQSSLLASIAIQLGSLLLAQLLINRLARHVSIYKLIIASIVIFQLVLIANQFYSSYSAKRILYPRILAVSKDWSIQGDRIEILGKRFGEISDQGSVKVRDTEFMIISWSNNRVVVEQPVPQSFFKSPLILTKSTNQSDQIDIFEIKDPKDVL